MYDLVLLTGTAGIGKTTTGRILEKELNVPYLNYGWLRQFYKDVDWATDSKEEKYAFEALKKMLSKHISLGYKNTIVDDLPLFRPSRVVELVEFFKDKKYIIISLVISDEEILKQRVLNENREGGFRNIEKAIKWNDELKATELLPNEYRIDSTNKSIEEVIKEINILLYND